MQPTDQLPPSQQDTAPFGHNEGTTREWLARRFLSLPPAHRRTPEEETAFRSALRLYWEIETHSVIRTAGLRRPLRYGNLGAAMTTLLEACRTEAQQQGFSLSVSLAPASLYAFYEPRLAQLAAVGLLRSACAASPDGEAAAALSVGGQRLSLTVTGQSRFWDADALRVAKEAARLHRGSLAVSENTAAFSISARTGAGLTGAGIAQTPTVSDYRTGVLSLVKAGFQSLESPSLPLLN